MPPVIPVSLSGNEITDAGRTAALAWATNQQGGSTDGLTVPGGVGIWEAGTNLFRRGQCDATTNWNVDGTGSTSVATDATVPPPFSTQSIKVTTGGVAANEGIDATSGTGQAAAAGINGVGSLYFKGVAGQSYTAFIWWSNADLSINAGTSSVFTATGSWQVITPASVAVGAGKTGDSIRFRIETTTQRAESFWVAHCMLQSGVSVVSPYIATSGGATATRAGSNVNTSSTLLNATTGWMAAKIRMGWASTVAPNVLPRFFVWQDGGGTNYIRSDYVVASNQWQVERSGGSSALTAVNNFAAGDVVTLVAAWTATTIKISVNGAAFVSVANNSIPTGLPATFQIGDVNNGGNRTIDSSCLWFAYGPDGSVMTDAYAAAIAAMTTVPYLPNQLPGRAIFAWPAVNTNGAGLVAARRLLTGLGV